MIKKLKEHDIIDPKTDKVIGKIGCDLREIMDKLNEVIDAVNTIQKEREAEWFEIQEWIGILEAVRKSVNIHEKQIDELQMKVEPEKCKTPPENVQTDAESRPENVRLPYMQNKRLRKALGIAQSALVKLANDAYDMDEHIYIDKILNQIERITKGSDNAE